MRFATAPVKPRMTFKDRHELEKLPGEIEALERDIARIEEQLGNPAGLDGDGIARLAKLLETAQRLLGRKNERWLELEMVREDLEGAA